MSWLDRLKGIVNIELNAPLINITRNSDNRVSDKDYFQDPESKELFINFDRLPPEKQAELSEVFNDALEEGEEIYETETKMLLEDLYSYQKSKDGDNKILDFFRDIISKDDFEALEASLYLRSRFSEHREVGQLKGDIKSRFGDRGKNIANLCTAGYFENFLMPLYNSSKENFLSVYDVVVSKSAMAIFVCSNMEKAGITSELSSKIELSKRYGLPFIHIHGIGQRNIFTIKNWVKENREVFSFMEKDIYENEGIIIVELLL